ncbi:MAG: metalloregulator ArsR/SmtB family transcription factor [Gammaproteobacteria bacterium]|nr:metalloregulator ArsR/SmtB family transcription factor [Gammaproteobacteria bacterium]
MTTRTMKDPLYEQVARIGKALASPKRLELLELLAQGEKTVEMLAAALAIDLKLASAHLKALAAARIVASRRDGKYRWYRLSGPDVAQLWVRLRDVAETHLAELRVALHAMAGASETLVATAREALLAQARSGAIVVIDVRPRDEYDTAHLPFARSLPLAELEARLAELPADKDIVVYCRGPFCVFADTAVRLLTARGYRARKLRDGVNEWQAAGLPLARVAAA